MKTADKPSALKEIHYRLLTEIRQFVHRHGFSPSVRDLGGLIGIRSTSHIRYLLRQIEAEGFIRQTSGIARSIVLVRLPEEINPATSQEPVAGQGSGVHPEPFNYKGV